jgi:hypothetical protein
MYQPRQVVVPELGGREIDGYLQRRGPRRCFAAGFTQDPFADRNDEAAFLGERNERIRGDPTAARVQPADQRLEADDFASGLRLRLIMHAQLAAIDR